MVLIERVMSALAGFLACDIFGLDSRDVERARPEMSGRAGEVARCRPSDGRHVVVRFGR